MEIARSAIMGLMSFLFFLIHMSFGIQSEWICNTNLSVVTDSIIYTGHFKLDPLRHPTLIIRDNKKIIAKVFPQDGIHWINKTPYGQLLVSTDGHKYIELIYKASSTSNLSSLLCREVL